VVALASVIFGTNDQSVAILPDDPRRWGISLRRRPAEDARKRLHEGQLIVRPLVSSERFLHCQREHRV
jgi:hypothetical protein